MRAVRLGSPSDRGELPLEPPPPDRKGPGSVTFG